MLCTLGAPNGSPGRLLTAAQAPIRGCRVAWMSGSGAGLRAGLVGACGGRGRTDLNLL